MPELSFLFKLVMLNNTGDIIQCGLQHPQEVTHLYLTKSIFIKKMSGNDSISIYSFCSNYVHKYWFLLLKNHNHYTILNCSDFNEEWEELDNIFSKLETKPNYETISNVLWLYKLNADYHPTPPYPNLKKIKDANGNIQKSIYPPRRLVVAKSFIFNAD